MMNLKKFSDTILMVTMGLIKEGDPYTSKNLGKLNLVN